MSPSSEPVPSADPVITHSSGHPLTTTPTLRLLHFNDVYHLDPSSSEPVGGAARFVSVVRQYQSPSPNLPKVIPLFSGDVFNPSLESSVTKGSHMVPILNTIGTRCSCVGNHDLDFGVLQFASLTSKCNFPWLLANVLDPALGESVPLGNAKKTHVITTEAGVKIGLIGLAEKEWLETVNALPPNLVFVPPAEVAVELASDLRSQGCDLVIALTHMREPNDHALARDTNGCLDLILGGHDHFYAHALIEGTHVLRSGSDFKQLSYLELRRDSSNPRKWAMDIWRRDVVSSIRPDTDTCTLVDKLTAKLKANLSRPIGWTTVPLDARFTTVRRAESNIGNLVCDIMRHHHAADAALMAAGTIRGDVVYAPGPIRLKDITDCFPFEDPVVVIRVTAGRLWESLENSVSTYPALEGRFPQVSNITLEFDPSKPAGQRIVSAAVGGKAISRTDDATMFTLATRGYMSRGKDGFTSLLGTSAGGPCQELVSEENGTLISTLLRQYFMALRVLGRWRNWSGDMDGHWGRVVSGCAEVKRPHGLLKDEDRRAKRMKLQKEETTGWEEWNGMRERRNSLTPLSEHTDDTLTDPEEEDNDEGEDVNTSKYAAEKMERELGVMRRVFRKWCRLAGVHGKADGDGQDEHVGCNWTTAVAPRVEGRIRMVGDGVKV